MANPGGSAFTKARLDNERTQRAAADLLAEAAWQVEEFTDERNAEATAALLAALQREHPAGDRHAQ